MTRFRFVVAIAPLAAAVIVTASASAAVHAGNAAACASVPSRYYDSPAAEFFVSACAIGQLKGPTAIARSFHFSVTTAAGVARQYAAWTINAGKKNAVVWARIQQVGVTKVKAAVNDGMLAGFRARRRP